MVRYLITDPSFTTTNPHTFYHVLEKAFQNHTPTHACFRDKQSVDPSPLYDPFLKLCAQYKVLSLLNGSVCDAKRYGFFGVHIRSNGYEAITQAKEENLLAIASCHTCDDLVIVKDLGCDMGTLSPIWRSPNKGEPLGLERLNEICDKIKLPIIALGGVVTQAEVDAVSKTRAVGFASIRYFFNTMDT